MSAGRLRPRWVRAFWVLPLALGTLVAIPPSSALGEEKLPEVWVGTRRVSGSAPAVAARSTSASASVPAAENWNSAATRPRSNVPFDPPPELKNFPSRKLPLPEPVSRPQAITPPAATPPVRAAATRANGGVATAGDQSLPSLSRSQTPLIIVETRPPGLIVPVSHQGPLMPAANVLPEIPERHDRYPAETVTHPHLPQDAMTERPRLQEKPEASSAATRESKLAVESSPEPEKPLYVTVMAQMLAVLAALTIFCVVALLAHFILVRKYGTSFLAPFRVEVVTTGPPAPQWTPPPLKELTALKRADDDEPPIEPNFELGPTYEEEMALRQQAAEQRELGVLQFIADMNRELQEELKNISAGNAATGQASETTNNQ